MDTLRRFLSQFLWENEDQLLLSEARRNQLYMSYGERKVLSPQHLRFLILA